MAPQKLIRFSTGICLIIILLLSGCQTAAPTAESSETAPSESAQEVALPAVIENTPTSTKELTPTNTALPSATATLTPSPEPTNTPTLAPSPTSNILQPGFYATGGCFTTDIRYDVGLNFCVVNVQVQEDGSMMFTVSWTIDIYDGSGLETVLKISDRGNTNMWLEDSLGNRYDHFATGGAADDGVDIADGETVYGYFMFPHAVSGVRSFTFHDDDQGQQISNIILTEPIILYVEVPLKWNEFSLNPLIEDWEVEETETGAASLIHTSITNCVIEEWQPSPVEGKYKNTVTLGGIEYEIYGWYDDDNERYVREYLVIGGIDGLDPDNLPLFRVYIPPEEDLACINAVTETLSTFQTSTP